MLPRLSTTLASPGEATDIKSGWITECKYDGLRVLAYREMGQVRLVGRSGNDVTRRFQKVARAVLDIPGDAHIFDGELVTFDPDGVSKLHLVSSHGDESNAVYVMFDAPFLDGVDLRRQPLSARREMLEQKYNTVVSPSLMLAERFDSHAPTAFAHAKALGLEGIVAKDPAGLYTEDRSTRWVKLKALEEDVFDVIGYTKSEKRGFSALMVADGDRYMGRVGTGFNASDIASLGSQMAKLATPRPSIPPPVPVPSGAVWLKPGLRVRVEYLPGKDHLRFPVYLGTEAP